MAARAHNTTACSRRSSDQHPRSQEVGCGGPPPRQARIYSGLLLSQFLREQPNFGDRRRLSWTDLEGMASLADTPRAVRGALLTLLASPEFLDLVEAEGGAVDPGAIDGHVRALAGWSLSWSPRS